MWQCIWQDFVFVSQKIRCTVWHPATACLLHWCCWTILRYGVMQHNFLQKWCNFACLCAWASGRFFQGGPLVDFFKSFSRVGAKSRETCFLPLETEKRALLLKFSNSYPLSTPMLVCRKIFVVHHWNIGVISSILTPSTSGVTKLVPSGTRSPAMIKWLPAACSKNNISMNAFILTNINTKIIESELSKIFISEVYIKVVALRINRYTWSSSQFRKDCWPPI